MHKTRCVGAAVVIAVLALTACSSSDNNATSGSNVAANASPNGSSGSASGNAGVAEAIAEAKAAETFPTQIPVTEALPSKPPTGKTVVFLQCEEQQCGHEGDGIDAAAKAIGWTAKTLNFKAADPATLVAALKTALQYHPVGVFFSGVPQAVWGSVQQQYADAGSFITENFDSKTPSGPGVLPGRGYANDSTHIGELLADMQIQDSNGQPANSLLVNVKDYPVFGPTAQTYHSTIAAACPSCEITDVNVTIQDLQAGKLDAAVIAAAKRASNPKYIVSVNGGFIGQLPQDLQAAGLGGKFKIISGQGGAQDQANVKAGKQLVTVSNALVMGGWQDVDMAIRTVMHLPIPQGDHIVPISLLTKDNVGTPADSADRPTDFAEQFKKIWQVG